jgi:hypothetical protein
MVSLVSQSVRTIFGIVKDDLNGDRKRLVFGTPHIDPTGFIPFDSESVFLQLS